MKKIKDVVDDKWYSEFYDNQNAAKEIATQFGAASSLISQSLMKHKNRLREHTGQAAVFIRLSTFSSH